MSQHLNPRRTDEEQSYEQERGALKNPMKNRSNQPESRPKLTQMQFD
jgi:hypothetical protein